MMLKRSNNYKLLSYEFRIKKELQAMCKDLQEFQGQEFQGKELQAMCRELLFRNFFIFGLKVLY